MFQLNSLLNTLFVCDTVSNLYIVYNNNCLFDILLTTEIFKQRLFSSHAKRIHTRLTEFLLPTVCFDLPFNSNTQTDVLEVECLCSLFLEDSIATALLLVLCVHITVCVLCTHCCLCVRVLVNHSFSHACCWLTYNQFDVFVSIAFVYRSMLDDITLFLLASNVVTLLPF